MSDFDLGRWAKNAVSRAMVLPEYDGDIERNQWIVNLCISRLRSLGAIAILTRDNLVDLGWWKNEEYARSLHLSISFRDPVSGQTAPFDAKRAAEIARAVFGTNLRKTWWEPAYTPEGKARGVQHWRLFFRPDWITPLVPRGEPYTLNMPGHWRRWTAEQEGIETPNFNADITDALPQVRPSPPDGHTFGA